MGRMRKAFGTLGVLLAGLALVGPGRAQADSVSAEQARTVAENFVTKNSIGQSVLPGRTVDAVARRGGFYLVTLKPSGHVLVSANRSAEPIPVFSEHDFAEPEADSPKEAFLAAYETNSINATGTKYETQWKALLGQKVLRLKTSGTTELVNIPPMVTSVWGQGYPYFELTPVIDKDHTQVGCVGTAYAQIMWYWRWPEVMDRDFVTEHSVRGQNGHKWQIKAGTEFGWESMPATGIGDYATRLKLSRGSMFAGMLAEMSYDTNGSAAQTTQPGINWWYTPYTQVIKADAGQDAMTAAMRQSLQDGCPFMVSIMTGLGSHAVVGDGWQENENGAKYVHLNYGWQDDRTNYGSVDGPIYVLVNQKPKPMVQNRPLLTGAKLPMTIDWAFPTRGYEGKLTGFDVTYTPVSGTKGDWVDDMENSKGFVTGSLIQVGEIGNAERGKVLRIDTAADYAIYTWPTVVATKDTVFSYRVHSKNSLNMVVELQIFDQSTGWRTISTPEIVTGGGERFWEQISIPIPEYAGKGVAIRVVARRKATQKYTSESDLSVGVQLDDITLTNVYQPEGDAVVAKSVDSGSRSVSIDNAALTAGSTYLFQVTPKFNDESIAIMPGSPAACRISDSNNAKPTILSVSSVVSTAPPVQENTYRVCYFGLNQFGVYGSSAMTDLKAYLSNLVVFDKVMVPDVAFPGAYVPEYRKISVEDAVEVRQKSPGNFLVRVDTTGLTDYLTSMCMVLSLVARNDQGDVCRKDMTLYFSTVDNEPSIEVADLPENGGTVVPVEPDPVYYTVTFDSAGGSEVAPRTRKAGSALGTLDTPVLDGCEFVGWFTSSADGGVKAEADTPVTGDVVYYARWKSLSGGDTPGEDEPEEPESVCMVTFDSNGGAVTLERQVAVGGEIGALPNDLVRTGYALEGWYTAREGGEKIDATRIVSVNTTFYAHWTESSGGGDEPGGESGGGNPVDDGNTRFCHGVSTSAGSYGMTRMTGYTNRLIPTSCNLILWWVDRYVEINKAAPTGYDASKIVVTKNDGTYTIQSYADELIGASGLSKTLTAGTEREKYFPSAQYTAAQWYGTGAQDTWAKEAGKKIYAALANGPIGVRVPTSSTYYYAAVIWGCDYATSGGEKYATAVYITDTTNNKRSDPVVRKEFGLVTNGYGTYPGIKNFNSSNAGVIEYYYPIVGPAGSRQEEPRTYTVVFDSDGGSEVTARSVVDGGTINPLPRPTKAGFDFGGWFDENGVPLTASTQIAAGKTYKARWTAQAVEDCILTFDAAGGTVSPATLTVAGGTAVSGLPTPVRAGCAFDGWYDGETKVEDGAVLTGSRTLVARWTVVYTSPFTFAAAQDADWSDVDWQDAYGRTAKWAVCGRADAEVRISGAHALSVGADLSVCPASVVAGREVSLAFAGAVPPGLKPALQNGAWQGTVVLAGTRTLAGETLADYGNAGSTVELAGDIAGYFAKDGRCASAVVLSGTVTLRDGWSGWNNNGVCGYTFAGALSGGGTLTADTKDINDVIRFTGDTDGFTGVIVAARGHTVAFGEETSSRSTNNMVVVRAGYSASVTVGRPWSAANGMVVEGTLNLRGLGDARSVTVLSAGALTVSGTLATNGVAVSAQAYEVKGGTVTFAEPAPSVQDGRGTVEVVDGKAVVTPAEGVSEIALAGVGEGQTVELPPSVGKVTGVSREQIRVRGGTKDRPLDLTGAMRMAEADGGVTLALDPEAKVTVDEEEIPVRPALAGAGEAEPPLAVAEGTVSLSVKTIPGLRYRLLSYGTLGGEPTAGEARAAEGSRLTLEAPKGAASGFFKVEVMP